MKYLTPVDRHMYQTDLIKDIDLYEIYPWMGIVIKIKINDRDIPIKIVSRLEEDERPHKYIDVSQYKKLYNIQRVNTLKIWTDLPT